MRQHQSASTQRTSAVLVVAALAAALAASGCAGGTRASTARGGSETVPTVVTPPVAAFLAARSAPGVEIARYDGRVAGDTRLPALADRMLAVVTPTLDAARDEAGVAPAAGRALLVVLVDDDVPPGSEVVQRLVDGVRRPVVRVPARRLVSGEFVPEQHLPRLLVEAAVVASAGDRTAPAWLRAALGVELGGAYERLVHERALGGAAVTLAEDALFPRTPADDDPLRAALRLRALARIARGERALARFVAARLEGAGEADALARVGVQDALFLDAAAETEMSRARESLDGEGPWDALAAARAALAADDPARGVGPAAALDAAVRAGRLSPWLAADARIVLAEFALARGDGAAAATHVSAATADAPHVVRVERARLTAARAAREAGRGAEAAALYRAFAADFPDAREAGEAREALGVDAALAAAVPGILSDMGSADAAVRQRLALRLGDAGLPSAAAPLRQLTADAEPGVRRVAYTSLALLLGEEAAPDLERGTFDPADVVRAVVLGLLPAADAQRGLARAKALLEDPSAAVRDVATRIVDAARPKPLRPVEAPRQPAELPPKTPPAPADATRTPPPGGTRPVTPPPLGGSTDHPLPPPKPDRPLPAPGERPPVPPKVPPPPPAKDGGAR